MTCSPAPLMSAPWSDLSASLFCHLQGTQGSETSSLWRKAHKVGSSEMVIQVLRPASWEPPGARQGSGRSPCSLSRQPPCCWPRSEGTWPEVLHRQLRPCLDTCPWRQACCVWPGLGCPPQRSPPHSWLQPSTMTGRVGSLVPEGSSSSRTWPLGHPGIPGVRGHCLCGKCCEANLSIC